MRKLGSSRASDRPQEFAAFIRNEIDVWTAGREGGLASCPSECSFRMNRVSQHYSNSEL
jgi:hypothetical protein